MGIFKVNGSSSNSYEQMSGGKRINRAADDAAGLSIAKKTESVVSGLDQGTENMKAAKNMLNVADSALASITDSLQRLRDLAVQAQNTAIYGDDDIKAMQDEADQLIVGIDDVVNTATYNNKRVLDGMSDKVEMNGEGQSMTIDSQKSDMGSLGLSGLNIADNDALKKIDEAISKISENRSGIGASTNALDYEIDYNKQSSFLQSSAQSTIEDLDYAEAVSEKKKNEVLEEYSMQMQKKQQEQEQQKTQRLLGLL